MTKPTREETDALWAEYQKGPDYSNVLRWLSDDRDGRPPTPESIESSMKWLFRSAILCATDPAFLDPGDGSPEAQPSGDE